jgi:hypothetical protein
MDLCTTMMQERKKLESILENADLKTKSDAIEYAEALTKIIWNHNMLGKVYEYYDENALYKGMSGKRITNLDELVGEFLGMQAAFPDLRVHITESFASGNETDGFAVYQRSYCEGTNLGTSQYGPATGNKLNEKNSFGQTVYILKKVKNTWKVVTEYSLRSNPTIVKLLKNEL